MTRDEVDALSLKEKQKKQFIRRIYGSAEFTRGLPRYCLWINDEYLLEAMAIEGIRLRIEGVKTMRLSSKDSGANEMAERSHQMREMNIPRNAAIVVPRTSTENRNFLPC